MIIAALGNDISFSWSCHGEVKRFVLLVFIVISLILVSPRVLRSHVVMDWVHIVKGVNLGLNRGCLQMHVILVTRLVLNLGVHLSVMFGVVRSLSNMYKSIMNCWDVMCHCNVLRHVLISGRFDISMVSLGGFMLDNRHCEHWASNRSMIMNEWVNIGHDIVMDNWSDNMHWYIVMDNGGSDMMYWDIMVDDGSHNFMMDDGGDYMHWNSSGVDWSCYVMYWYAVMDDGGSDMNRCISVHNGYFRVVKFWFSMVDRSNVMNDGNTMRDGGSNVMNWDSKLSER